MKTQRIVKKFLFFTWILSVTSPSFGAGGYFAHETCESSRGFAKRVFLTKQMGMSLARYREVEGSPPPGKAGELASKIEREIFTNPRIASESLASEHAYSLCMTWPK